MFQLNIFSGSGNRNLALFGVIALQINMENARCNNVLNCLLWQANLEMHFVCLH